MTGIVRKTVPLVTLGNAVAALRREGYDRFELQSHPTYKREIDLKAWKYHPRPDKRKKLAMHQYSDGSTVEYDPAQVIRNYEKQLEHVIIADSHE